MPADESKDAAVTFALAGYFRSGTSQRVRIALNLKGIAFEYRAIALLKREHKRDEFLQINPQGFVPVLYVNDVPLLQSPAILEWIEEAYPEPPLLPRALLDRQRVRAMAAIISADIHPINNLRVLNELRQTFKADENAVTAWIRLWISAGFTSLEALLARDAQRGGFCFGGMPTLADCCLLPQIYSARRFGLDLTPYPLIREVEATCDALKAFADAYPDRQPDAPR